MGRSPLNEWFCDAELVPFPFLVKFSGNDSDTVIIPAHRRDALQNLIRAQQAALLG